MMQNTDNVAAPGALPPNQTTLSYPLPQPNDTHIDKGPAAACLFVAGMATDCTEAQLKALFDSLTEHGALWAKLRKDRADRSYAFVQLRDVADAAAMTRRALESAMMIGDRCLRVQFANVPRTVMVCCVPPFFVHNDVLQAMGEAYGEVDHVETLATVANVGFIKFRFREDALNCAQTISANPHYGWSAEIHNRALPSDPDAAAQPQPPAHNSKSGQRNGRKNSNNTHYHGNRKNSNNTHENKPNAPKTYNFNSNVQNIINNNNNKNNNNNNNNAAVVPSTPDNEADSALEVIEDTHEERDELSTTEKCQVFVGGIDPTNSNDVSIVALFARCGDIVSISIKNNSTNDMRRDSFAFVRYKTPAEAERSIRELHGTLIGNKKIRVQQLEPATTKRLRKARQQAQSSNSAEERANVLTTNAITHYSSNSDDGTPPSTPPHGSHPPMTPEMQPMTPAHVYPPVDGVVGVPNVAGTYNGAYDPIMQYQYQYWYAAYSQYYARYPHAANVPLPT